MPTSVTGTWTASYRSRSGFTLLEVMVVLVLIGIISSFAVFTVNVNDTGQRLFEQAQRLRALIALQQQEAIILGEQRGLRFSQDGYVVVVLAADNEWRKPAGEALGYYRLPAGMSFQLSVNGHLVRLERSLEDTDNYPNQPPQIFLLASGEASEFALLLRSDREPGYLISGDTLGRLDVQAAS